MCLNWGLGLYLGLSCWLALSLGSRRWDRSSISAGKDATSVQGRAVGGLASFRWRKCAITNLILLVKGRFRNVNILFGFLGFSASTLNSIDCLIHGIFLINLLDYFVSQYFLILLSDGFSILIQDFLFVGFISLHLLLLLFIMVLLLKFSTSIDDSSVRMPFILMLSDDKRQLHRPCYT